jgi:hypothetical protein
VTRFRAATRMQLESCAATCVENPRVGGSIPPQATTIEGVARENVLRLSVARLSHVLGPQGPLFAGPNAWPIQASIAPLVSFAFSPLVWRKG